MKNKVALITGGTSGIGRATAIAFAEAGANVVLTGRREKEGHETLKLIEEKGVKGLFIRADVRNEADCEKMVAQTLSKFDRLDFAFNNAGIEGVPGPLTELTAEAFNEVMEINVRGVFLSMKYEIRAMLKTGGGAIVNTSSIAGSIAMPNISHYVASKHAVIGLTKAAAIEFARKNIRVNSISPAAIETDMLTRFTGNDPATKEYLNNMHPIGRAGTAMEIATNVIHLCSQNASFITGHDLIVDGGFTAQ